VGRRVDDHQWGETENDMTTITAHEQQDIDRLYETFASSRFA
jgi:hypothetical protein